MSVWYKKQGYYDNPFMLAPMKERSGLLGNEEQLANLIYYIQSGSLVFVQGPKGSGKTKLLRKAIRSFRGRIIYVNAKNLVKTIDMEALLRKKNGLAGNVFGSKPRDMILFIDNATELSRVNFERIKFYYDKGYLQSVVFSGTQYKDVAFPASMQQRIGKRVIDVATLTDEQAVDLVLERLDEERSDDEHLITPELIKAVWVKSDKNPRKLLMNLQRVFAHMHNEDDALVGKQHLEILKLKLSKADEVVLAESLGEKLGGAELVDDEGNTIMKVGEYYRNPKYEMFCGNCGAIATPQDTSCPECHATFEANEGDTHA